MSVAATLDRDLAICPFGLSSFCIDDNTMSHVMNVIRSMQELKYLDYSYHGCSRQLTFTKSGLEYLKNNDNKVADFVKANALEVDFFIQKYNLRPVNFGPLANFFPQHAVTHDSSLADFSDLSKLSTHNILQTSTKLDEFGNPTDDYTNIAFTSKAPGELVFPLIF